jgi:putative endonuclease
LVQKKQNNWYIYILECSDKSLYTGITTNIDRRVLEHNTGKGSKYTKIRRPVKLIALFNAENRSQASKEEYRIKQLTKKEKLKLCEGQSISKNIQ